MKSQLLTITLTEDFHSGSGTGGGDLDALLALDRNGKPCLHWSTLKGILRDRAMELEELGRLQQGRVNKLFGSSGDRSGTVTLTGAYRLVDKGPPLRWSSSAREEHSRRPAEDMLRVVEYAPAGTVFQARLQCDEQDFADLEKVVIAVERIGSGQTRGDGLVHIKFGTGSNGQPVRLQGDVSGSPLRIRLLLRALDPVSLTLTAEPTGNLNRSERFIRGSTFAGALAAWDFRCQNENGGHPLAEAIWARVVWVSDALPLPDLEFEDNAKLASLRVLPVPMDWKKPRAMGGGEFPWWTYGEGGRDVFSAESGKRVPDGTLMRTLDGTRWEHYRPALRARLRIDKAKADTKVDLFAQEEMLERTLFVCDLVIGKETGTPDDVKKAVSHLDECLGTGIWLQVGRGGRPVEVMSACVLDVDDDSCQAERWLAASDVVVRNKYLELTGVIEGCGGLEFVEPMQAQTVLHGFNGVSRLPRLPQRAVCRGSVFGLSEPKAWNCFGEGRHEGCGRMEPIDALRAEEVTAFHAQAEKPTLRREERLAQLARRDADGLKLDKIVYELRDLMAADLTGPGALNAQQVADAWGKVNKRCMSTDKRERKTKGFVKLLNDRVADVGQNGSPLTAEEFATYQQWLFRWLTLAAGREEFTDPVGDDEDEVGNDDESGDGTEANQ